MELQKLVREVDELNHDDFISQGLVGLGFFSEWQMDCLTMSPVIDSLAEDFEDKIFFGMVNIEDCEELAERHEVTKLPALLIFRDGELIERIDGFNSEGVLREMIGVLFD